MRLALVIRSHARIFPSPDHEGGRECVKFLRIMIDRERRGRKQNDTAANKVAHASSDTSRFHQNSSDNSARSCPDQSFPSFWLQLPLSFSSATSWNCGEEEQHAAPTFVPPSNCPFRRFEVQARSGFKPAQKLGLRHEDVVRVYLVRPFSSFCRNRKEEALWSFGNCESINAVIDPLLIS